MVSARLGLAVAGRSPGNSAPADVPSSSRATTIAWASTILFDVRVYGEPDLSGVYRVATDGTIDFPLAGRIQVSGLARRRGPAARSSSVSRRATC